MAYNQRSSRTFILRYWQDDDDSACFRLEAVQEGDAHMFRDVTALAEFLILTFNNISEISNESGKGFYDRNDDARAE